MMLAEAGLRPSFVVGGDVNEVGTGAQWTGGEWLVVEADESDGTFLELPAARHHPHQRRGRPPRPLRHVRRHRRRLRPVPRRRRRAEGACASTTRSRAGLAAAPRRRHLRHLAEAPTTAPSTSRADGGALAVHRRAPTASALGEVALPAARRRTTCATPPARSAMAMSSASPFDARRRGARPASAASARRFDVRGVDGGVTLVDDYAHLPERDRRGARRGAPQRRRLEAASSPCSSPTASTAWRCCRRSTATRSSTPTSR